MKSDEAIFAAVPSLAVRPRPLAQEPPAPGASPRIDAIRKAGVLRVGVLANAPWLVREHHRQRRALDRPGLAAGHRICPPARRQASTGHGHATRPRCRCSRPTRSTLSIAALAETPERLKVVDFVIYSSTSVCMFGLPINPKFAAAKTVDDLNKPGHHHRLFRRRRPRKAGSSSASRGQAARRATPAPPRRWRK